MSISANVEPIKMVDLRGQYLKIKDRVDVALEEVINSTAFIGGPVVKEFALKLSEYLDVKHVIPCANGTDALQIALMALDLKPGDEVITSNFTFAATVEVIALLKLKPILVDVNPKTFNIDVDKVAQAITPKTKVILPVHLFGQCADMSPILDLAKQHKLYVVEDNAQAIGAEYVDVNKRTYKAGTMGDFGTTSFFPSKNLGCFGDGGAIFTNNSELALKVEGIVNHGMYVRYYHDRVGVNSRLDSIQAAILDIKLSYLDEYNQARQKVAEYYNEVFSKNNLLVTPSTSPFTTHVYHQYTLQLSEELNREDLQKFLLEKGIPSMIYYPVPLHQQKAYSSPEFKDADYPVTLNLAKTVISLPMHTELSHKQLHFITDSVDKFINK